MDLETLKAIFGDKRTHIAVGRILKVEIAANLSVCRALVLVLPDEIEIVAQVAFPHAHKGGGYFALPDPDDFVIVAYSSPDDAYIFGYIANSDDPVPQKAKDGDVILTSRQEKDLYLGGKKGHLTDFDLSVATEPVVLGNVLATGLGALLTKIEGILDQLIAGDIFLVTSPGNPTAPNPAKTTALNTLKSDIGTIRSTYLTDASTNIKSKVWFTIRGE